MMGGMLERVLSGGQTGVDQAALRAARAAGIPTGGHAPLGWRTEDGPAPWLADYGLVEMDSPGYPTRTRANVEASDGTLWMGDWHSPGGRTTLDHCRLTRRPFLIAMAWVTKPSEVAAWIEGRGVRTLNVAGNRESTAPGIGARAEAFLARAFRRARVR
jgi:hypothetical protein